MSITSQDLKKVYAATYEARNRWRNIFLMLGMSAATIEALGSKWSNDPDDCYREGLLDWLKNGDRTWQELIDTLSSPVVGQKDIASAIEREHVEAATVTEQDGRGGAAAELSLPNPYAQVINDNLTIFSNENIGTGAFGAVFKGRYRGTPCAVKVLHHIAMQIQVNLSAVQAQGSGSEAFERECEFLKSFQHPNIVKHLSTDKHPMSSNVILVTELLDCNLRSYLSGLPEESLTSECQLSIARDIAAGLTYIHLKKVVHRDLCGDNVLLKLTEPIPLAKISDFGMSRLIDPSQLSSTLTAVGHRMGYIPPEALREDDELYDHSLDVFSLGVVMVQIARKLPTVKTVKDRKFNLGQIPITHVLKPLINECVQLDKTKRPSAKDVCAELERKLDPDSMDTSSTQVPGLRPPLTLRWRKGRDLPKRVSSIQSVVIADAVYVGGVVNTASLVMKLDVNDGKWSTLPQPNVSDFAMTSLADELVLVGGAMVDGPLQGRATNQISVFRSGTWAHSYPQMQVPRMDSTAVSFNNHIVVINGHNGHQVITSVEVFDKFSLLWLTTDPLPIPYVYAKSTLIGANLYVLGGDSRNRMVNMVDISKLIAKAASAQPTSSSLWERLGDTPLADSALLSVGNSLLAVGGHDDAYRPSSSIHLYQPETRSWVQVGDMPASSARWNCTCSLLPSGEVFIAGGNAGSGAFLTTVFFMSIN